MVNREQRVKINGTLSDKITTKIGVPQGCVLSPFLFSIYTSDCKTGNESCTIIKYADDTVVMGLVSENDEAPYRHEVTKFVNWCQDNNLVLNLKKKGNDFGF